MSIEPSAPRVPHGADRFARPGELCTCGRPALVVYESRVDGTPRHTPVGYCGQPDVAPLHEETVPTFDDYSDALTRVDYGDGEPGDQAVIEAYERLVLNPAHAAYTEAVARRRELEGTLVGPEPELVPVGVDGYTIGGRTAVCRHCGQTVKIVGGRYTTHRRSDSTHCRDSGRPVPPEESP